MKKLMRLDKAIERKIVENLDKVDPNALFPKSLNKVILEPSYTGVDETQEIYRQDFDFIFFKTRVKRDINLSMLAIGKKENKSASVEIRGETGYLWSSSCWREINKLYSNRSNGITAYSLSEEGLKFLLERNKKFKGFKFATWIDKGSFEFSPNYTVMKFIMYVRERTIYKKVLHTDNGFVDQGIFHYCPYIHIWGPDDIMVVLNSKKKNGKWKLIPRKGLLKWWYRLF